MARQIDGKHVLSQVVHPGSRTTTRVVAVVLLVAAAPMVAGMAGAASAGSGSTAGTTGTAGAPVDIVFVFDRSESTNEDRYHMAQAVDRLASRFGDAGIDARYGLVTYNGTDRVEQPLTSDFDSFEEAMHFTDGGNEEQASDAILTATNMNFRDDAEKVVVVVTDEDDDSSNATRDAALSSLSGFHFVAVSPSSPFESSCAVHSPPCDDRTDNELRTMATQAGGDWISQDKPAADIVDGIADIVESTVDTGESSSSTPDTSPSRSAEFSTTDLSANRTTVEVGDLVRFNKTVENVGTATGTYDAYLSHGGTIVAERTVTVPAGESRTFTFVHQFEDAGEYDVLITHELVATVTVTEPNDVSVDVASPANGSRVNATVADARTNDTVSIPIANASLAPQDVAVIESVVVWIGNANVTPAHDVAFDVEVVANETPPNGTNPLPEHVSQVRYLTVNTSLPVNSSPAGNTSLPVNSSLGDFPGVQFDYVPSVNGTTLYRYDANGTWTPLNWSAVNGTDALRTDRSNATTYAIGVRQPAISVTDVTLEDATVVVGDTTSATVTVSNVGTATGSFNVTLRLNGSVVGTDEVTVPANETRSVTVTVTPDRPGTYTLDVPGGPSTTLQVDAAPTETSTTETPSTTRSTTPTSTSASTPGFGLLVAVVALVGAALLARRRE